MTDLDQFDFGDISLSLKPKADERTEIKISSEKEDYLHEELGEWVYEFSKFKSDLVIKEENKLGSSYRLK